MSVWSHLYDQVTDTRPILQQSIQPKQVPSVTLYEVVVDVQ